MNFVKSASLTLISLALLGACRVETPDGRVPQKYISEASKFEGTYSGNFEGQPAQFSLSIANDGTAAFDYSDSDGDIVGRGCDSSVGSLTALWATSKKVGGADFALHTDCNVEGKNVLIDFNKNGKVVLRIVKDSYTRRRQVCDGGQTICQPGGHCTTTPPRCHMEEVTYYNYLEGRFTKH